MNFSWRIDFLLAHPVGTFLSPLYILLFVLGDNITTTELTTGPRMYAYVCKRLVTPLNNRRYINNFIYLSIYVCWCILVDTKIT